MPNWGSAKVLAGGIREREVRRRLGDKHDAYRVELGRAVAQNKRGGGGDTPVRAAPGNETSNSKKNFQGVKAAHNSSNRENLRYIKNARLDHRPLMKIEKKRWNREEQIRKKRSR